MPEFFSSVAFVSLDVFDTVLTRNVYQPHDLYQRIQRRLEKHDAFKNVALLAEFKDGRLAAEAEARTRLGDREEVNLQEIMAELIQRLGVVSQAASDVAKCEIEEEIKSVLPVELMISLVREQRKSGKSIVFVSDMYLPDNVIKEMLEGVGVWEPQDKLYVSGSLGIKKSSGTLFRHVLDDLQIKPNQMVHIGDYLLSDYLVPRFKIRIPSFLVRMSRNNIYERLWGDPCRCLYCSSMAGASRAARVALAADTIGLQETALYNLGCNILGPMLVSFILWTLKQAEQGGIRRLYFLSRDGEVMLEVARELANRLGTDIELRYLHVSRTAVFPALLGMEVASRTIKWLKEDNIVLTLRILADRLKLDVAVLHQHLLHTGFQLDGSETPLSKNTVADICDMLIADPRLRDMASGAGKDALRKLAGYLEQEGLFDEAPFALVDLGWHGSIQDALSNCFMERFEANGISGYYFGVDRGSTQGNKKRGFFFNQDERGFYRHQHLFRILLEIICSGRHGMVQYYQFSSQGKYEPVLLEIEHPDNKERVENIRRGIKTYIRSLDMPSVSETDYLHVRPQIAAVLKKLFFYPSRDESVALGKMRFSADQAGHHIHQIAPPLTLYSTMNYLIKRSYAGRSTISSWFFASWSCSPLHIRVLLYPLILCLRIFYVGFDVLRFWKLKLLDFFNRSITVDIGRLL